MTIEGLMQTNRKSDEALTAILMHQQMQIRLLWDKIEVLEEALDDISEEYEE